MRKIPVWLIVIIVVAIVFGVKFLFFPKSASQKTQGKKQGPASVSVNYYVTRYSELSNDVFATGKIGALNSVEIIPEVSGKVSAILFKEGENVKKGTQLVKLNDADLQAQLIKTRVQLKLSEQKLDRLKKLVAVNGISQEEFDMQENELQGLRADEAYILAQIAKTSIVAPFDGVAGLRNVSEGAFVNASTPIVDLVQLSPVFVEFSIPEKYGDIFKTGGAITFSTEGVSTGATYSATVYAIDPRVDETTKTIRARALYRGDQQFFPGSFVKVRVLLASTHNVIMIPSQAVVGTLKGQKVFLSRKGVAMEVPVEIGVRTDKMIQIIQGLNVGDTVLTTALLSLKNDLPVNLLKSQN